MTLNINYRTTNPREVDILIEGYIEAQERKLSGKSIKEFGAKCDTKKFRGGLVTTQGSAQVSHSSGVFKSEDVGKLFYVAGGGIGGALLATTILSVESSTTCTLAAAAGTTLTSGHYMYGSDDTAAWAAANSALVDGEDFTIYVPYGLSLTEAIPLKSNQVIIGKNPDGWAFKNYRRTSGIILKPGTKAPGLFYGVNGSVGNVEIERLLVDGGFRFHKNAIMRYSGATTVAGSNTVNFTNGSFTNADIGKKICIFGAGVGGGLQESGYFGVIRTVNSVNQIVVDDVQSPATTAVTNAAYVYGMSDLQGVDGATTAASSTFTAASATFAAEDVGKIIEIYDCMLPQWGDGTLNKGDGVGELLVTHITAVISPTQVTLMDTPELTTTGRLWRMGATAGMYQMKAPISQDSMWHIDRCLFTYFPGCGYAVGLYQRAQRFYRTSFWQNAGHGAWLRSSDSSFVSTMFGQNGEDGFYAVQSTNHMINVDTFGNEGNGAYMGGYATSWQLEQVMFDVNGKNGLLDFSTGTVKIGCRWTSNSQRVNGLYNDMSVCRRYMGGVSNLNTSGNQVIGGFWDLGGNGNKPAHGIDSVGPYGIRGNGVQWNPDKSLWTVNAITSSGVCSIFQHSFVVEGGNTITFAQNNTLAFDSTTGTRIGGASTQKIGFWGATPVVRPTVTGSRGGNAAVASLLTQLAAAGLIVDSSSA